MAKKLNKQASQQYLNEFFTHIEEKTPKEIRKMFKLAMAHNIKLREKRRLFCKKCFAIFNAKNSQIRIKNQKKIIKCLSCNSIFRWKIKTS